jgi:biopolymer transport protein ExbB/TolQ
MNSTLDEVSTEIDRVPNTRLAKLIASLITLHSSTGSLESIQDEIDLFIQNRQERFISFRTRLDFLSDSAGALGLLGTVWGIFNAFESRDWRPENILPDIGFALVTTFIGIIASLLLNLLSTEVFNYFNRKIALLQLKVDEFRKSLYRHHSEVSGRNQKESEVG